MIVTVAFSVASFINCAYTIRLTIRTERRLRRVDGNRLPDSWKERARKLLAAVAAVGEE